MSLHQLSLHKEEWPLRKPFRITGHEWVDLDAIVVELTDGTHIGRGEASGVYYLDENTNSMVQQIQDHWNDIENCPDGDSLREILPPGGARNAVDCALWDLTARRQGTNIWQLAQVEPGPVQTVMTIPIRETPEEMGEEAGQLSDFRNLKIKLDHQQPVERIAAIRAARPDANIVIDANPGFTLELLREVLPHFERLEVSMVEQPLPRGGDDGLEGFQSPVPLCADESCLHLDELDQAARRYQMINIKLDKCGGLTEGLMIARRAQEMGLGLMVGNMIGTSLAMMPGMVIARLCSFVDLDGPLHLKCDRAGGLTFNRGEISTPAVALWGSAG